MAGRLAGKTAIVTAAAFDEGGNFIDARFGPLTLLDPLAHTIPVVIAAFAPYRYEGKAAIVTPLAAALQPIVTIILALIFLREKSACLRMPTSATGRFDSW